MYSSLIKSLLTRCDVNIDLKMTAMGGTMEWM